MLYGLGGRFFPGANGVHSVTGFVYTGRFLPERYIWEMVLPRKLLWKSTFDRNNSSWDVLLVLMAHVQVVLRILRRCCVTDYSPVSCAFYDDTMTSLNRKKCYSSRHLSDLFWFSPFFFTVGLHFRGRFPVTGKPWWEIRADSDCWCFLRLIFFIRTILTGFFALLSDLEGETCWY